MVRELPALRRASLERLWEDLMRRLQPSVAGSDQPGVSPWSLGDIGLYGILLQVSLAVLVMTSSVWLFLAFDLGIWLWLYWRCVLGVPYTVRRLE